MGVAKLDNYYPISDYNPPEYKLYTTNDSTILFFKIPAAGILTNIGDQKYKVRLQVEFYSDFTKKNFVDSLGFDVISNFKNLNSKQMIEGKVNLGRSDELKKPMVVDIFSKEENLRMSNRVIFLDSLLSDPSNFLLYENNGKVVLNNFVKSSEEISLIADVFDCKDVIIDAYDISMSLPKPPFSSFVPAPYNQTPKNSETIKCINGRYNFKCPKNSFLVISAISNPEIMTSIFRFDENYPEVNDLSYLVDALRYITTEDEYEIIQKSENRKEAIDEFWLSCSGSKERARKLIKNYYSRVSYSNRYFTSHVPGWKSDRGLIYVIFGPPKSVFISGNREFWDYGESGSMDNVSFEFVKARNPYSGTDFRLIRNEIYKPNWYRVVSAWREGRIFYE